MATKKTPPVKTVQTVPMEYIKSLDYRLRIIEDHFSGQGETKKANDAWVTGFITGAILGAAGMYLYISIKHYL